MDLTACLTLGLDVVMSSNQRARSVPKHFETSSRIVPLLKEISILVSVKLLINVKIMVFPNTFFRKFLL